MPKRVEEEVVFPPKYKRTPGRSKKSRHKNSDETISQAQIIAKNMVIKVTIGRIVISFQRSSDGVVSHG